MVGTTKVIPPRGKVHLIDKDLPTCEWERPHHEFYAYERTQLDITAWKDKLNSIPDEFWNDQNQIGNVHLVRPAHDAWGIDKIVFTFCDDFLQKIIDLPFSYAPEWQPLLDQVYTSMGIEKHRVVRSLLARMPPGANIPVHHDTGYWVHHTHRCHLPIFTGDEVEFLVGPTANSMQPYDFSEGKIIELNNQAKHAVQNKMQVRYRVHLIFDYVDEDYPLPERKVLSPGDIVYQTRRSLDIEKDTRDFVVEDVTPRFIVIGAQKCGTTSMYEYLCQHPLVVKGKRRETHYFDWRFNHKLGENDIAAHRQFYLNFFEGDMLKKHPSLVTGESTPSYLLHSDIVLQRLLRIVPWAHLIVMLRNPVDRAFSQFQMIQDSNGTTEQLKVRGRSHYVGLSFEEVVEKELKEMFDAGITPESSYDDFKEKLLKSRPMDHGGHSLLMRGLYALQLQPYLEHWPADRLKILSIKQIQGTPKEVKNVVNEVFDFVKLPRVDILDIEPKNTRKYEPLSEELRFRLERFFEPFNERLFSLLGRRLEW